MIPAIINEKNIAYKLLAIALSIDPLSSPENKHNRFSVSLMGWALILYVIIIEGFYSGQVSSAILTGIIVYLGDIHTVITLFLKAGAGAPAPFLPRYYGVAPFVRGRLIFSYIPRFAYGVMSPGSPSLPYARPSLR